MRLDTACSHIVDCEHKTAPIDVHGDYFAVGTPAMRDHLINYHEARRISRETFEAWTRRLAPKVGDLLLAREAPVGPVVRIPSAENVAPGQRTVLLRPDPDITASEFLYYLLRSPRMQTELLVKADGSTVHHLNVADIRSLDVTLPPLPEQQAIAEVLGALDDKIAANTHLAANTNEFLAAHFDNLIQESAEEVSLGSVADVNAESMKPVGGGYLRYVDIASVNIGSCIFPDIMSWEEAPGRARRRLRRGDTIWSTVRPNRRSHALNLSDDPLLVASTGLAVLTPRTVSASYLYEATRRPEFTAYLENVAEGSAYPAVRAERFEAAPIPLISDQAQRQFNEIAEPLREIVFATSEETRTLAATRDALLPKLMSGQLRVRDAEKIAEQAGV